MCTQKVTLANAGNAEGHKERPKSFPLNEMVEIPETNNFDLKEYFKKGNRFSTIDEVKFNDWFDRRSLNSPAVVCQRYKIHEDVDRNQKKFLWPSYEQLGGDTTLQLKNAMSQQEFLDFIIKYNLYVEFTIVHIAFMCGFFPGGLNCPCILSTGGDYMFLVKKKNGQLGWLCIDVTEEEPFEHDFGYNCLFLYDFEPNLAMPNHSPYLLGSKSLFFETIK